MKIKKFINYFFIIGILISCKKVENFSILKKQDIVYLPLPNKVTSPINNQLSIEKIALGKLLFFDPILSGGKNVACATCHHPKNGYTEFRDLSIGVNGKGFGANRKKIHTDSMIPFVKRNAHTILNTAFNGITEEGIQDATLAPMFWDNRVSSLETQALEPIKSLEEMRGIIISEEVILDTILTRLNANKTYVDLFKKAYKQEDSITSALLGKAIAAFERSLITPNSRFDQFMRGDKKALSSSEKEGFETFKRIGCADCHSGPMFSDYKLHILSMADNDKLEKPDDGAKGEYLFRTPTLRNLQYTAPYMHNGKFNDLQKVMEFYEEIAGGKSKNSNVPSKKIDSLILKMTIKTKDFSQLISFINALNDNDFDKEIPESVPSNLSVGGDILSH